jgi:hypothetical protein
MDGDGKTYEAVTFSLENKLATLDRTAIHGELQNMNHKNKMEASYLRTFHKFSHDRRTALL